ncbi:hypothetical protein [Roseixanthobacter glucoisosaccharinicivorans]|uniref:hypothetical protein n=1 Tax=Roseixanthobacter glucoisosaccharinicivorans TaxID=3119923 RepID=UPI00372716BA
MVDLILRPSGLEEKHDKPWSLQLRNHSSVGEVEYLTLACVSDDTAREIVAAGNSRWLFGEPDWHDRARKSALEQARVLREKADSLEAAAVLPAPPKGEG